MTREPANGQVAVSEYTVAWGHAMVRLRRSGAGWVIEDAGQTKNYVYFPEDRDSHEAMMGVATEYAKRLDALVQLREALVEAEYATQAWLRAQVYRAEPQVYRAE